MANRESIWDLLSGVACSCWTSHFVQARSSAGSVGITPRSTRAPFACLVVAAAAKVVNDYGGDAGSIWSGNANKGAEVFRRLDPFPGIGQKKAAMAVEILERNFGVPIADMHDSDIAYDVHVRRVFLRTGLPQRDDLDHMVEVARQATRTAERSASRRLVGRQWCHAGIRASPACVLRNVCPKDVAAAASVRGA